MLREKLLHQLADFNIVPAQAGEVFHKYGRCLVLLQQRQHSLKLRAIHGDARNTVVIKVDEVGITFLLGDLRQQLLLVLDAVTVAFEIVVTGEAFIQIRRVLPGNPAF